mgnify:CR=1 FL=1
MDGVRTLTAVLRRGCRGDLSPAQTKELRSMMFSLRYANTLIIVAMLVCRVEGHLPAWLLTIAINVAHLVVLKLLMP